MIIVKIRVFPCSLSVIEYKYENGGRSKVCQLTWCVKGTLMALFSVALPLWRPWYDTVAYAVWVCASAMKWCLTWMSLIMWSQLVAGFRKTRFFKKAQLTGFYRVFWIILFERTVGKLVGWFRSSAKLFFHSSVLYLHIHTFITYWWLEAVNIKKSLIITGMTNWGVFWYYPDVWTLACWSLTLRPSQTGVGSGTWHTEKELFQH